SASGISAPNSLSTDGRPMVASIRATSASVWARYRTRSVLLLRDELAVGLGVHQLAELALVAELDLQHPALVVRVVRQVLGRVAERGVDLDDLARQRGVDVRHRLDALDTADDVVLADGLALLWP